MSPAGRGFAVAFLLAACGCAAGSTIEVEERSDSAVPWTRLELDRDPERFAFVVVGDRTGGHREGVFARAVTAIERLRPDFVVSVGDLVEGSDDADELEAMWSEYDALVSGLSMPFFYVPGNHDYASSAMARDWNRRFGPSFYHFRHRDVLFLVLNSELMSSFYDPGHPVEGGDAPEEQVRFAERVLAANADARWTFVFLHQPFWDTPGEHPDWERVEGLLGDRPYTVFAGHYHRYTRHVRNGRDYVTLATAGGASRLRGIARGEFDHIALVTMTADGPVIANLMLDGIHDVGVRTLEERGLAGRLERVVRTEPLKVEGEVFRSGVQRFALHNTSDVPVTVRGRFDLSPHFQVSPRSVARTLPPRGSDAVEVSLRAHEPVPITRLTPSLARWTVQAEAAGETVTVESTSWLVPERVFPVPRSAPVVVDGELGEWGSLRFDVDEWPQADGGAAEASLRFDLRWDDAFLYLAFAVEDASATGADAPDSLIVEIDARPDPERSANTAMLAAVQDGTVARLLVIEVAPEGGAEERLLRPAPEGLLRSVRSHEDGYDAELAVPASLLDERAGGPWQGLRLNLALRDPSDPDPAGRTLRWRPSRFSDPTEAIPGAGTFARE